MLVVQDEGKALMNPPTLRNQNKLNHRNNPPCKQSSCISGFPYKVSFHLRLAGWRVYGIRLSNNCYATNRNLSSGLQQEIRNSVTAQPEVITFSHPAAVDLADGQPTIYPLNSHLNRGAAEATASHLVKW